MVVFGITTKSAEMGKYQSQEKHTGNLNSWEMWSGIRKTLKNSPGVSVVDYRKDGGYVTPEECVGEDKVFVSRIRKDNTLKNGISLWIAADNLRKGAALNAIQIGEELIKKKILKK